MPRTTALRTLFVLVIFSGGFATGLLAQGRTDSPRRVEQKRTDLSGAPDMEVISSISEFQPGESTERHFHHGIEAGYVIQGTTVQYPGKEPQQIATGTPLLNLRDVKHSGYTVVGPASLKIFTVHVVDKGKPLYEFVD